MFSKEDLRKIKITNPSSRYFIAIQMLLNGDVVDLTDIPSVKGRRCPSIVKRHLRKLFEAHGINNAAGRYWL